MVKDILIENQSLSDINPRVCGMQECAPGHSYGPSIRDYYLLHYVMRGAGVYHNPRGSFAVGPGRIFVIRPGEVCTYTADQKHPWQYSWVGFSSRLPLDELLTEDVFDAGEIAPIFGDLTDSDRIQLGREWFICGKVFELLAHLRHRSNSMPARSGRYVGMALNYIHSSYMNDLHVGQIAAYLGLDRSYFSNLFKAATGFSPQQYILSYRLEKAADFLANHGLRPSEAAQRAGYQDIVNFSRMFKRKYGVPPSCYSARRR